ncbi:MAG: BON domain-containing protein [Terriglobales bacterium]
MRINSATAMLLGGSLILAASFVVAQQNSGTNAATSVQNQAMSEQTMQHVKEEVRHQLILLPYYGVFDNLSYQVSPDRTVTLQGQVSRPTLKADAGRVVKNIEGVESVNNQIKVLPTSPMDDQIRMATYRAIYGNTTLSPYALRAVPPIHIIVDNGHVTLEGVVARQMDSQIAETQAKGVPGVFSVTNNLRVEQQPGN